MKKSTQTQIFKIGRMSYGLPSVIEKDGEEFRLSFTLLRDMQWLAQYEDGFLCELEETSVVAPTFNGAIKAMHKHLKTL